MQLETIQPSKRMKQYFGWGRVCRGLVGSPTSKGAKYVRGKVCQGLRCPGIPRLHHTKGVKNGTSNSLADAHKKGVVLGR